MKKSRAIPRTWAAGVAGVLGVLTLVGCNAEDITERDFRAISLAEVRAVTTGKDAAKTLVVDSRLAEKFESGHIPGARNLQLADARAKTGETLNPELWNYKNLIVYGEDPASPSARAMTMRLMTLEHKGVRFFEGGIAEWLRAGLPTESSKRAEPTPAPDTK